MVIKQWEELVDLKIFSPRGTGQTWAEKLFGEPEARLKDTVRLFGLEQDPDVKRWRDFRHVSRDNGHLSKFGPSSPMAPRVISEEEFRNFNPSVNFFSMTKKPIHQGFANY